MAQDKVTAAGGRVPRGSLVPAGTGQVSIILAGAILAGEVLAGIAAPGPVTRRPAPACCAPGPDRR
jgi:hypothetical protein